MGNKPYVVSKLYYTDQKMSHRSNLRNKFCLSPYETSMLNYVFHKHTGGERRMHYRHFRKLYKAINSELSGAEVDMCAPAAFCAADSNQDGSLSFDEFVDAYSCFKATPDFARFQNAGLFFLY